MEFNGKQSDRVILYLAVNVPILSSTYYATREFDSSSLEPPLGSGNYKVGKYSAGQFIESLSQMLERFMSCSVIATQGFGHGFRLLSL